MILGVLGWFKFQSRSVLAIEGLRFDLPNGWNLDRLEKSSNKAGTWSVAWIKVPDPKYQVKIPFQVSTSNDPLDKDKRTLLKETSSGAKIYDEGCAPAIACYELIFKGVRYEVSFGEPKSNQDAPKDLDGPWFPDTTVTEEDTLNFLATVR
ncbi:hypothetical protein FJZ48_02020 [Candidatus Uhrbacteria bacterium]|nr:hypothetical protein [Candidatus Uhrbacteria bacterium]